MLLSLSLFRVSVCASSFSHLGRVGYLFRWLAFSLLLFFPRRLPLLSRFSAATLLLFVFLGLPLACPEWMQRKASLFAGRSSREAKREEVEEEEEEELNIGKTSARALYTLSRFTLSLLYAEFWGKRRQSLLRPISSFTYFVFDRVSKASRLRVCLFVWTLDVRPTRPLLAPRCSVLLKGCGRHGGGAFHKSKQERQIDANKHRLRRSKSLFERRDSAQAVKALSKDTWLGGNSEPERPFLLPPPPSPRLVALRYLLARGRHYGMECLPEQNKPRTIARRGIKDAPPGQVHAYSCFRATTGTT